MNEEKKETDKHVDDAKTAIDKIVGDTTCCASEQLDRLYVIQTYLHDQISILQAEVDEEEEDEDWDEDEFDDEMPEDDDDDVLDM